MSATGDAPSPADKGATLLEMLVVVALLAMSTAIAFPLAAGCYERLAAQVARSAVAADLRSVRSLAQRTDVPVSLQVFDDGRRYRAGDRDVLLPASMRLSAQPARITFFPTGVAEGAELRLAPLHGAALTLSVEVGSGLVRNGP